MLRYLAELHGRSVVAPTGHFKFAFETLGPGYMEGRAFGHWDLTHERLDEVRVAPGHVRDQIRNELAGQQPDGLIPGLVLLGVTGHPGFVTVNASAAPAWKSFKAFPPVWVWAVDAYVDTTSAERHLTVTWIRELPALGTLGHDVQKSATDTMVDLVVVLTRGERFAEAGIPPLTLPEGRLLIGGIRELTARTMEDGEDLVTLRATISQAALALLAHR